MVLWQSVLKRPTKGVFEMRVEQPCGWAGTTEHAGPKHGTWAQSAWPLQQCGMLGKGAVKTS